MFLLRLAAARTNVRGLGVNLSLFSHPVMSAPGGLLFVILHIRGSMSISPLRHFFLPEFRSICVSHPLFPLPECRRILRIPALGLAAMAGIFFRGG